MDERFGRDTCSALATVSERFPLLGLITRMEPFYVITYAKSDKRKQIANGFLHTRIFLKRGQLPAFLLHLVLSAVLCFIYIKE